MRVSVWEIISKPFNGPYRYDVHLALLRHVLIFLLTCPLGNYVASFTCRVYFLVPKKNHQLALLAVWLNFQYLCLLTLMPSINPKRNFMVFFSSSCTSQGKSRSHDVWYFRSRLLFPAKTSGWDSAFLLSPGSLSFVEFKCCVAWMSSLLVTVSSDFRVKPKRNKLMVAHQAAIFVCLVVRGKNVRGLGTNLPLNTCSWRKTWRKTKYSMYQRKDPSHCTCFSFSFYVHLTKISKKESGDFAAAVGFYSCPSGSSVILNHLPKRATCAAYTLAKRIILLAPGKWASVSVEHCRKASKSISDGQS